MRAFPCERAQGKCSSDEINITIVGVPGAMCSPVREEVCEWCHKWRVRVFLVWNDKVFALWILVASSTLMCCYTYDATCVRTRSLARALLHLSSSGVQNHGYLPYRLARGNFGDELRERAHARERERERERGREREREKETEAGTHAKTLSIDLVFMCQFTA